MSKRVGGPKREHGPFFNFPLRFLRSRLAVLPDSLRLYGTCDIRGLRHAAPTSRGAWGQGEADAAGVKKQHFLRDRFEAKPGDLKLVVLGGPNPFSVFSSDCSVPTGTTAMRSPDPRFGFASCGACGLGRERVGWLAVTAKTMRSSGRSSGLLKQQTGETVPERFEAKPGDMKLIVCRVINGTWAITKPSLAKAEDRLSAIKCSG